MPGQSDISKGIRERLSITDPQMNTGLGSPVRDIIDSVAAEISAMVVDQYVMSYQFDLELYSGTDLYAFVSMFGFAPLKAAPAMGTLRLTRDNGDSAIYIPPGTQFFRPATSANMPVFFQSFSYEKLDIGELELEIPVRAAVAGAFGNVPAGTVTDVEGNLGVVSVTNLLPMTGGRDTESDDALRERFKATIFRNVSGTQDQYVALALAHALNSRALLVGQVSRWNDVLTISETHQAVSGNQEVASVIDPVHGVWLRNVDTDEFYQETGDFTLNTSVNPPRIEVSDVPVVDENVVLVGTDTSLLQYPDVSSVTVTNSDGTVTYTEDTNYEVDYLSGAISRLGDGIPDGATVLVSYSYFPVPQNTIVRLEYEYLSTVNRGAGKSVELYVDGRDIVRATDLQFFALGNLFVDTGGNMDVSNWVRENGISSPEVGNVFMPLASCPLESLPGVIEVGAGIVLTKNQDFWLVRDLSPMFGSVRARDGIEFDISLFGVGVGEIPDESPVRIEYTFNRVVQAVQDIVSKQTPVATDTLVHAAKRRFFEVNVTVMYHVFPRESINDSIKSALGLFFGSLPLGAVIQFSDIETVVANLSGVDSVRVSVGAGGSIAGLREFAEDGSTQIGSNITEDFVLASNELPVLFDVNVYSRTQETW